MKRLFTISAIVLCGLIAGVSSSQADGNVNQAQVSQYLASQPLAFTKNMGQWPDSILFRADAGEAVMWITTEGVYYQFTRRVGGRQTPALDFDRGSPSTPDDVTLSLSKGGPDSAPDSIETLVLKAAFVGANPNPTASGGKLLDYKCNYFLGNDPSKWRTDVPNYEAIVLEEVYPGIDLTYYGNGRQMEYDFVVNPGADYSQIRIQYEGAEGLAVADDGALVVTTKWGEIRELTPVVYQEIGGTRRPVASEYIIQSENTFGFRLGQDYEPTLAVVIDPVLVYSTYLGGSAGGPSSGFDGGYGIAVDAAGCAYVTGVTGASDFPTFNPFDGSLGDYDAFVTKLSSLGHGLYYSTYLGGSAGETGKRIAVDGAGNAYVTGQTSSSDFPTVTPYDADPNDVFVTKLSPEGNSLVYSTYLGGSNDEEVRDIAVDGDGSAYVTGETRSGDFPTVSPFDDSFHGPADAFVTKLSPEGNSLMYSTYLGGFDDELCRAIAVDAVGSAYVTGQTMSGDFPTVTPLDGSYNGGLYDVFVTKLNPAGNGLVYSTFLGGNDKDHGHGIVVDGGGNAYITGWTLSSDFPTVTPSDGSYNGNWDAFVAKLSPAGSSLIYSTYLGGSSDEFVSGITVDGAGSAYVTGSTGSSDFPTFKALDGSLSGGGDAFVTKLSPGGNNLAYSTYLGGDSDDGGGDIVADGGGSVYVTGSTQSSDFPTEGEYQPYQGVQDAFVAKIKSCALQVEAPCGVHVYAGDYVETGSPVVTGPADCLSLWPWRFALVGVSPTPAGAVSVEASRGKVEFQSDPSDADTGNTMYTIDIVVIADDNTDTAHFSTNVLVLKQEPFCLYIEQVHDQFPEFAMQVDIAAYGGRGSDEIDEFHLAIEYDADLLDLLRVDGGSAFYEYEWESFTYDSAFRTAGNGTSNVGLVILDGTADVENGAEHPLPGLMNSIGFHNLARLTFIVECDTSEFDSAFYFGINPIRWSWDDCSDNFLISNGTNCRFVSESVYDAVASSNPFAEIQYYSYFGCGGTPDVTDSSAAFPSTAGTPIGCDGDSSMTQIRRVMFFHGGFSGVHPDSVDGTYPISYDPDCDGVQDCLEYWCDNCPTIHNPYQADGNGNGVGDACDVSFTPVESDSAAVTQVVTADLDLDTYVDVVYLGETGVGLFVSWGQLGDPPIGAPDSIAAIANADIKVFHLNNDAIPDIIAVSSSWVYSLINNGDRTFTIDSVANTTGYKWSAASPEQFGTFPRIALGFFDTDRYPDLVVSPDKLFSGDGSGSFTSNPVLGFSFEAVDVSDFDSDGRDDIVAVGAGSATVYLNSGAGSFMSSGTISLGLETYDLASVVTNVDFDRDGLVDIVAAVAKNTGVDDSTIITIAAGDGLGGLTLVDTVIVLGVAPQLTVSDVDRDFHQDVVISDASSGRLLIRYNDGSGGFELSDEVVIGTGGELRFALASADLDRNGQPDFVSGSAAGDNLILALNNLPDAPVLGDEMFVTGYDYVDVRVTNPLGFVISRTLQTVAGSAYWRLLADTDEFLDVRTYDYNLQFGLYRIEARPLPGGGPSPLVNMGIGIDGSQQRTVFSGYRFEVRQSAASGLPSDEYAFDFEMEAEESIRPRNGIPTDNLLPRFDWSRRVTSEPEGTVYRFELDEYHDFRSALRLEGSALSEARYRGSLPLSLDSVYYWRYLTSHDNGVSYPDTSLTFAVYASRGCCWERVGDVNGEGDYPDEVTLGDIMLLVDVKFISGDCSSLLCIAEADVNQDGGLTPTCEDHVTLGDIMVLVDHLFISNTPLKECL